MLSPLGQEQAARLSRAPTQEAPGLAARLSYRRMRVRPGARSRSSLNPRHGTHIPPGVTGEWGQERASTGQGTKQMLAVVVTITAITLGQKGMPACPKVL